MELDTSRIRTYNPLGRMLVGLQHMLMQKALTHDRLKYFNLFVKQLVTLLLNVLLLRLGNKKGDCAIEFIIFLFILSIISKVF